TLVCDNRGCLGKPANETEALGMLRRLNNKNHFVHTACLFHCDSCIIIKTYTTRVSFKNNPDSVLHNYIAKVDVTDAAGAYKIQDNGDMLIKKIKGSYSNVVGLPEIFLKYTGILLC
ncbi:MAG TPA: Maf family protein, partial [Spirochaetota bacterium]|nr:Maf family protein [Spirochaetota bacterium]